jgi:hypothetical protein
MNSYAQAVAAERDARDYAFLDLPSEICGVDVLPMTLRTFIARVAMGCPFLRGYRVLDLADPVGHIGAFLWHLSVARARSRRLGPLAEYHARTRFNEVVARIDLFAVEPAIDEYLEETFLDAPVPGGGAEGAAAGEVYTSIAATLVDLFAFDYGWPAAQVLDAPLVQLHQLLRSRSLRKNPNAILFNRKSSKARSQAVLAGEDIFGDGTPADSAATA